ncbi:MAG: hypothetical protein E6Q36_05615 [Chryseobacterium sp.]|nr:MAG: hypothetical protein E6Q36_05615 [Chryseobacterium sp.]
MKTVSKERQIELDCAIAYFMGWRIDNSFPDKNKVWRKEKNVELNTTFKFSTDWNQLMEVYEAINQIKDEIYPLGCQVVFDKCYCEVLTGGGITFRAPHKEAPIPMQEFVYRCMGEFIEHYNKTRLLLGVNE